MVNLQGTDTFQDSQETINLMTSINDTFPLVYPGYTIDVNQGPPIKESQTGQTGCMWNAVSTSGQFPNADQPELSPTLDTPDWPSYTQDQIAGVCATIMETFASSNYYNSNPQAVRGQAGPAPYQVPTPVSLGS
jgi:hypothetical protein